MPSFCGKKTKALETSDLPDIEIVKSSSDGQNWKAVGYMLA